jgi:molecular chaperone Hsp33
MEAREGGPVPGQSSLPVDDLIQPFRLDATGLRGRLVRLGPLLDRILGNHDYPEPVCRMLAEMLALGVALAHALQYDGVFTLQTQSDGPIGMMVVDVTSRAEIRGCAKFDESRLKEALVHGGPGGGENRDSVPRLLGAGYLAFTVDPGAGDSDVGGKRYQGIVELQGATLTDCAHHYFRQSEPMDAAIRLAVTHAAGAAGGKRHWRAASMMVQRLSRSATATPFAAATPASAVVTEDDWRRTLAFMGSATDREMLDPRLGPRELLYRLFHEDDVRAYRTVPVVPGCRCSREKVRRILGSFPREEIDEMKINDQVVVTCEFCGDTQRFDDDELRKIYEMAAHEAAGGFDAS